MPNGKYSGQKLIKLVRMKTPARTKRIMAKVSEIMFAKYKPAITIATSILTTLSDVPIFGFIVLFFM
jgi:hypothetical protein